MKLGAIFDWDGVVVNSVNEHLESWQMLASAHGHILPENFMLDTFGKRNLEIIPEFLQWTSDPVEAAKMSDEKETYFREIIAARGVPTVAGISQFLEALNAAGIPCAVGSSTPRANLEQAVYKLGFGKYFTDYAAMEDVKRGKPAPDVFLCAAKKIGVEPSCCAVFEDSEAGIDAAIASGAKSVAIATTHPAKFWLERPRGRPDFIMDDFSLLDANSFKRFFA